MEAFAPDPFDFDTPQGKPVALETFEEFVWEVSEHSHWHGIAWRGQADARWRLTSSAFNAERFRIAPYAEVTLRGEHAQNILWISQAVEERMKDSGRSVQKALGTDAHLRLLFQSELTDPDIHNKAPRYTQLLSVCQHFGMKTPMLDMTDSPYVALYFAAYDSLVNQNHAWRMEHRLAVWQVPTYYWNPRQDRPMFEYALVPGLSAHEHSARQAELLSGKPGDCIKISIQNVFPRDYRNERLVAQQGSFVRVTPDLPLDHVVAMIGISNGNGTFEPLKDRLVQYTLPARYALDYLVHLKKMNVRHETLFPDLMGEMGAINLAMDHYDYAGQGDRITRGSMFDVYGGRRGDFWV